VHAIVTVSCAVSSKECCFLLLKKKKKFVGADLAEPSLATHRLQQKLVVFGAFRPSALDSTR